MIAGLQPCSFIDFPGRLAAVLFTQGCNMRCRYCHNPQLCPFEGEKEIVFEEVRAFLESRRGKLIGVVVSGGEPTLHKKLPGLLRKIRSLDFAVKLDTNGSRPGVVLDLAQDELLDYVAVDVKVAPGSSSLRLCGMEGQAEYALKTLRILVEAGIPCEARTTVIEGVHNAKGLGTIALALALAGVPAWRLQPVEARVVLDPDASLAPPAQDLLNRAAGFAASLGIDAVSRPVPYTNLKYGKTQPDAKDLLQQVFGSRRRKSSDEQDG